jgi:predicted RNA binding protein YcfA (HicA-like mRNA interferase family)
MVKSQYSYISWKQFTKILKNFWEVEIISQKCSHIKIRFNKKITTIVPNHKELAYWTFHFILKQLQIDEREFIKYV